MSSFKVSSVTYLPRLSNVYPFVPLSLMKFSFSQIKKNLNTICYLERF